MENLETISPKRAKGVKEYYLVLFSLTDEKIDEVLELIEYGRIFPKVWQEDLRDGCQEDIENM